MAIDFKAWDEPAGDTAHVVGVRGEIDLFTAPEFKQHIHAAIEDGAELVVVDLCEASFIDSSSLGVLISAARRARVRGRRFVIACDVPSIQNTFRITGLEGVLEIMPTREDALALAVA